MKYHRNLMQAIMYDKIKIADAVNVKVISLDQAPLGYTNFDKGEAVRATATVHCTVTIGIAANL